MPFGGFFYFLAFISAVPSIRCWNLVEGVDVVLV
jgi:hypothetical protein